MAGNDKRLHVLIATPTGEGGRGGIDRMNDMTIEAIEANPDFNVSVARLVTRGNCSVLLSPFVLARAVIQLFLAARRKRVDVLHLCVSLKGSAYRKVAVAAVARFCGVPYVAHLHGGGFEFFWLTIGGRARDAVDRMFSESGKIVLLGHYWVGIFSAWLPQTAERLVVLPNSTPPATAARIPSEDGRVRITFLGELGRRKGTPQLMKALEQLANRDDWIAMIAGNGDVEATRRWARDLGLADRIHVPGWLDSDATTQLMCRSDIVVLPTFIENLPMIIPEAFAQGVPVITTPVAAITEVVRHERNGLLIPCGDIDALAQGLGRLISDPALRERLGHQARADHAQAYRIDHYAKRLVELWREVARP